MLQQEAAVKTDYERACVAHISCWCDRKNVWLQKGHSKKTKIGLTS